MSDNIYPDTERLVENPPTYTAPWTNITNDWLDDAMQQVVSAVVARPTDMENGVFYEFEGVSHYRNSEPPLLGNTLLYLLRNGKTIEEILLVPHWIDMTRWRGNKYLVTAISGRYENWLKEGLPAGLVVHGHTEQLPDLVTKQNILWSSYKYFYLVEASRVTAYEVAGNAELEYLSHKRLNSNEEWEVEETYP